MNNYRIIDKSVKTLKKRLEYLTTKSDNYGSATSYDMAEITALRIAINLMEDKRDEIHNEYLRERRKYDN